MNLKEILNQLVVDVLISKDRNGVDDAIDKAIKEIENANTKD